MSHNATSPKTKQPRKRRLDSEGRWGLLFVSPYIIQFVVFIAATLIASLYFSFSKYNMLNPPQWIGGANYSQLFHTPLFWKSLWETVYFAIIFVPLQTILALVLAVALNQNIKGLKWFRMAHFIPVISSWTVILYVTDAIFNPRFGFANYVTTHMGMSKQAWLNDPHLVIPILALVGVWRGLGYMMVIFLAGLQSISNDLYQAADIDGAGTFRKFRSITVPMISPTTFLVLILTFIQAFQAFDEIYVMTGGMQDVTTVGGPNDASLVLMVYLYRQGFAFLHMGYASAIAWVLFIILFAITVLQLVLQRKWVHYE